MANRRASIWKYVRIGTGWRYCKPVFSANHKIKPDWVLVNGHEKHHPEGNYYLRLSANGGRWKKLGPRAADAVHAQEYEESVLTARAAGIPIKEDATPPLLLSPSLWGFLEDYKLSQQPESYNLMKQTLEEFAGFIKTQALADISRIDLLKYKQWLQTRPAREGKKNTLRTAGNKLMRVNQYLRSVQKLEAGKGLVTVKDAKFVEQEPEVFTAEELIAFFAACSNPFLHLVFTTFLMSGLRKQELENLEWTDVDFEAGTLKVCAKRSRGFTPKTWEERTIEIPFTLVGLLEAFKTYGLYCSALDGDVAYPPGRSPLVFANSTGHRYTHVWDDCQNIAERAKVNTGIMIDAHPHKFRATYCTRLLQSGIVDLKTCQKLMGHRSLESTMRYLAKAESHIVRAKLDSVFESGWTPAPQNIGA